MTTDFSGVIKACENEIRTLFMDKNGFADDERVTQIMRVYHTALQAPPNSKAKYRATPTAL